MREITGQQYGLPAYLNRAAYIGSFFHCVVPQRYLNVAPDDLTENAISNVNSSMKNSSYALLANSNLL